MAKACLLMPSVYSLAASVNSVNLGRLDSWPEELDLCRYSAYRHRASHHPQISSSISFTRITSAKRYQSGHLQFIL